MKKGGWSPAGVARETAIGHDEASHAAAAAVWVGVMVDEVLDPRVVGVADGLVSVGPTLITAEELARPVADVEGRVSEDEVSLEIGVLVAEERVSRLLTEPGLDAVDGEVHVGEAPRRGVALLPEDGDVGEPDSGILKLPHDVVISNAEAAGGKPNKLLQHRNPHENV